MKKIVVQDNFAYVYFVRSFYERRQILNSMEVYSDFFKAEIQEFGRYFVVKIELVDDGFSLETLALEFANYVLSNEYLVNAVK